jgi:hypothetical protein
MFKIVKFTKRILYIPFHTLLIAIYPVLFFYLNNIEELPNGIFLRPCILSCVVSILLFTLIYFSCKHIKKAGIITSFVLILFFSYGYIFKLVWRVGGRELMFAGCDKNTVTAYLASVIGLIFGLYCFRKMRGDFTNSTKFFNITSLLLVSMTILNILRYENKIPEDNITEDNPHYIDFILKANDPKPDIYYILLDGYPRADILKKYYNYDNSPFLERLESLGFNIIEKSQSNYDWTLYSVRSTLEMEYLDKFFSSRTEYERDNRLKGLRYTNVLRILYNSGYKTNAFKIKYLLLDFYDSPYITSLLENYSDFNRFEAKLLKSTLFAVTNKLKVLERYHDRARHLFILDSIPKFAKKEGPNFVFAHLMCPHAPFVFDANGDKVVSVAQDIQNQFLILPTKPIKGKDKPFRTRKKLFCDQLTYLNNRILQNIESILRSSDKGPVIIIQSDHGVRYLDSYFKVDPSINFLNLSAIYLPNGRQHEIPSDASNVNTFRYVFNHVFNTGLSILPNKQDYPNMSKGVLLPPKLIPKVFKNEYNK